MAKIDLPFVQSFTDRHGKPRLYFRRRGFKPVSLPGPAGSKAFLAAYAAALERATPAESKGPVIQPRSITALVVEYYRSAEFRELRPSSQRAYRGILDGFRAAHGDKGAASVKREHLDGIFHKMADRPAAAITLRKRLRRLFQLSVRLGWRDDNPVRDTEIKRRKSDGFTPWTEADIATFEARWPSGSKERLAFALLLYTGQRRSDVVGMGRQHVSGDRIAVTQVKTGHKLRIRLHPALQAELAHCEGLTFLTTAYGAPFTAAGFGGWFKKATTRAGLEGLSAHGLRKAAGRRLAEAGCTAKEIAAVLGHASLAEVERYTRDADQTLLSDAAMKRLQAEG